MRLRLLGAVILALAGWVMFPFLAAQAQSPACEDFDTQQIADWNQASSNVNITISNADSQGGAGDYFIRVQDQGGASWLGAAEREIQNWQPFFERGCAEICWDLRIFNDGDADSFRDLTPGVIIRGLSGEAQFKANFTVSEAGGSNPGWHRICAPIRPAENGQLPDDGTGSWMFTPINTGDTWDDLIAGIDEIRLPNFDTTGTDERADYDNICVGPCPSCLRQTTVRLLCEVDDTGTPTGDYLWTFQVRNLSSMAVHHLFFDLPAGVKVDRPQILFQPPILPNGVRTETVLISVAQPIQTLHFRLTFHDESMDGCCAQRVWLELPRCECAQLVEDAVATCVKPPLLPFQYSFNLQNLASNQVGSILLAPVNMNGSPLTPQQLVLQPNFLPLTPIPSGEMTGSLSVAISGPLAQEGEKVCFRISTHDPGFEECCSIVQCVTLPHCLTAIKDPPSRTDNPAPRGSGPVESGSSLKK